MDEALPKDIPKTAASSIVHAQGSIGQLMSMRSLSARVPRCALFRICAHRERDE